MSVEYKPTNPKDSVGVKKVPFSTVPMPVIAEVGLAMLEGARKYGRHNYRDGGVLASVYFDAALRHLTAWWEGEDLDPESGLSHITKAIASLVVLRDAMRQGVLVDDRPPACSAGWVERLNAKAAEIVERYPDAKPPYTQAACKSPWTPAQEQAMLDAFEEGREFEIAERARVDRAFSPTMDAARPASPVSPTSELSAGQRFETEALKPAANASFVGGDECGTPMCRAEA